MSFDPLPDNVLDGDPVSRFFEILREADPMIAEQEVTSLIDKIATLEAFIAQKGLEQEVALFRRESEQRDADRINYCIGAMAHIVSQHER